MAKNYAASFKCPHGDADEVLLLRNREETLEQIRTMAWYFECPVHGVQREVPVEANEIIDAPSPEVQSRQKTTARTLKRQRRSRRIPLQVRVQVYGRTRAVGSFHEETATRMVNAHGGSVTLTAPVNVGETLLVVNMATRKEQECRVVSIESLEGLKKNVGVAFAQLAPNFWGVDFPRPKQ